MKESVSCKKATNCMLCLRLKRVLHSDFNIDLIYSSKFIHKKIVTVQRKMSQNNDENFPRIFVFYLLKNFVINLDYINKIMECIY